jgi:hypothetical protein
MISTAWHTNLHSHLCPIALLVIAADSLKGGRAESLRLAVNFDGFESELQTRSPRQPTGWTCIHHQSFDTRTRRNDGVFIRSSILWRNFLGAWS